MPRLIHLNGPPRVGKSTLARRWADDHPGSLVLDPDLLSGQVGAWRDDLDAALETARGLVRVMALHHLRGGHDVVVPQLVTAHDEHPDLFADTAGEAGASYVEVVLLADRATQAERLAAKQAQHPVEAVVQGVLEQPGSDLLERIAAHLAAHLEARPDARRLDTTGLDEEATYALVVATIERAGRDQQE